MVKNQVNAYRCGMMRTSYLLLACSSIALILIILRRGWSKTLLPELPKNSVVVMDNAAFHKSSEIADLLKKNGHRILWLPPYSPDLNPIEHKWAWIKSIRNKLRLNNIDLLLISV